MKRQTSEFLKNLNDRQSAGGAFTLSTIVPSLLSFLFLIVASLLGGTKQEGYQNADWYLYASYLITPIAFIVVFAIFFRVTKKDAGEVVGRGKKRYFALALFLQFGLFSLSELNSLFLNFLSETFGYRASSVLLPSVTGGKIIGVVFVVAVLPAITEELMFRGVLLGGLKKCGAAFAVLVSGALFSLYHQNPSQTAYQFVCGVFFALVALKAGSILPTVLSHFINNVFVLILYRFGVTEYPTYVEIPFLIISALCLIGSTIYLLFFDKGEKRETEKVRKADFFLYAGIGIFLFAVSWLTNFFSGV